MKTKAKKFSKKLLALFMAIVMGVTCFSGAISAYGITKSNAIKYTDDAIDYNELGWAVLSDEQVATALLDYLDTLLLPKLKDMEPTLKKLVESVKISPLTLSWDLNKRQLNVKVGAIPLASITIKLGSVDELSETISSVRKLLDGGLVSTAEGLGVNFGAIGELDLTATSGMSRANNTSVEIIRGVVGLIYKNIDIIQELLLGTLDLGVFGGIIDVYAKLAELVGGAPDSYQTSENGMVYSLVQSALYNLTNWFTDEELIAFNGGQAEVLDETGNVVTPKIDAKTFVFDEVLLDKMTTKLLDKISVLVTYDQEYWDFDLDESGKPYFAKDKEGNLTTNFKMTATQDTSATRYAKIKAYMTANSCNYATAAEALHYDPNLVYSDEFVDDDGNYLNVLLFAYGSPDENGLATKNTKMIKLTKGDSLFTFGKQALAMAWNTVLKDTLKLLHVNYDVDRGHGSNFDNAFYYYMDHNTDGLTWNRKNPSANYTDSNIRSWAKHMVWKDLRTDKNRNEVTAIKYMPLYESYGITVAKDPANVNPEKNIVATEAEAIDLFISWVRENLTYTRDADKNSTGDWTDIDPTTLFNKTRYSPLADFYFNIETGPINLYFMQLGCKNIDTFFDAYFDEKKDTTDASAYSYSSMVAGLNDALVAAVSDIFTNGKNVHNVTKLPKLETTGDFPASGSNQGIDATAINTITNTLINNTLKMVQYTADAIDGNILKSFYANGGTTLTEANIEKAMIPLLIATLGQINLDGKLVDQIHRADWNACDDAEDIAFIALREYLSNVQPNYDYSGLAPIVDGKYTATLNDTILPMARDAIMYVIESYVPVTDGNGNHFKVEYQKPGDPGYYQDGVNDLFTLFNRIICYYAEPRTTKTSETDTNGRIYGIANGVACLLGLIQVDSNKNVTSLVNTSNSLWTNIDIIANKFAPVLGTLQYGAAKYGEFSSQDLIWNKVVKGILDIGPNSGVTNFINQLLTIVAADPIQNTPVTLTVYDLLEDLLNALFGPRYTGQSWVPVPDRLTEIPENNQATPFDYVLKKAVLAGADKNSPGILGKALNNLAEFTGVGGDWRSYTKGNNYTNVIYEYPDSLLPGVTFAIVAVSSLAGILPMYNNHSYDVMSANFKGSLSDRGTTGTAANYVIRLVNNSTGINTTTIDGMNSDAISRNARYYVEVTGAEGTATNGATISVPKTSVTIDPYGASEVTVKITPQAGSNFCSVKFTYNVFTYTDSNTENTNNKNNKVYVAENQTTTAYKVINTDKDWIDIVYPAINDSTSNRKGEDGKYWFPKAAEDDNFNNTKGKTIEGVYFQATAGFGTKNRLHAMMPDSFVLKKSNLSMIENFYIPVRNTSDAVFGGNASYDGVFCYDNKTVYDDISRGNVTVNFDNAIPSFDATTGDILKMSTVDYSFDNGANWAGTDVTADAAQQAKADKEKADGKKYDDTFVTRPHIVYTLQQAIDNGIIAAYHKNDNDIYEYIYLKGAKSGNYTYANLIGQITMRGPVQGTYMVSKKESIAKDYTTVYSNFFRYDGVTDIPAGEYSTSIRFYTTDKPDNGVKDFNLIVADDRANESLGNSINTLATYLNRYTVDDYTDGGTAVNNALSALQNGMAVYAQATTAANARTAIDKTHTVAVTAETTNELGDKAYVPYSTSNVNGVTENGVAVIDPMPKKMLAAAYEFEGYYYYDEEGNIPLYTKKPLTDADVDKVNGTDAVGMAVSKGTDGAYYYVNDAAHDQEWILPEDTDQDGNRIYSYHILVDKAEQLKKDGKLVYDQVQFEYYTKDNKKVNSDFVWAVKRAVPQTVIYDYDGNEEYRGCYTAVADEMKYQLEQVSAVLKTNLADTLFENITMVRNGLNQNNFDITTYNKMTKAAKDAESKFSVIIGPYTDKNGNTVKEIEMRPADAAGVIKNLKDQGINAPWTTNSTLTRSQIANYQRLFDQYLKLAVERGYLGNQVEAEIQCTTGTTYDNLTVVSDAVWVDQVDENGNTVKVIDTPAVVQYNNAEGVTVPFGAVKDGKLVNEGTTKYTEATWNTFVTEIAEAVTMAQTGNSTSYAGKDRNYYNTGVDYTACVSECYSEFKQLRVAEIALIEDIPVGGYNVTASLVVAKDATGTTATPAVAVNGEYTIVLTDAEGKEAARTTFTSAAGANTFTLEGVQNGTYTMTITSAYSLTRNNITVVVNGAEVTGPEIPIIACDYKHDAMIDTLDASIVYQQLSLIHI